MLPRHERLFGSLVTRRAGADGGQCAAGAAVDGGPAAGAWLAYLPLCGAGALLPGTAAMVAVGTPAAMAAENSASTRSAQARPFDISAQPRAEALYDYSFTAGIEVRGTFTPKGALSKLLMGTGLGIRYTGADTMTLVPMRAEPSQPQPQAATAAARPMPEAGGAERDYGRYSESLDGRPDDVCCFAVGAISVRHSRRQ